MICNGSENDNVKFTVKIKINCVSLRVEIIYVSIHIGSYVSNCK